MHERFGIHWMIDGECVICDNFTDEDVCGDM